MLVFDWFEYPEMSEIMKQKQQENSVAVNDNPYVLMLLTICSVVKPNNFGPKMAGAKNLKNMKPDITE